MSAPLQPSVSNTTANLVDNSSSVNPSSVNATPQVKIEQDGFLYINNVQMSVKFGGKEVDISKMSQEQKDCLVKFWQELATEKPEAFKDFQLIEASILKPGGSKVGLVTKRGGDELQSVAVTINHASVKIFQNSFEMFNDLFKSSVSAENTGVGTQEVPPPPPPPPPLVSNANEVRSASSAKSRGDINFKMAKLQTELQSGLRDNGFLQDSETDIKGLVREALKHPEKMDELNNLLAKLPEDMKKESVSLLEEIKNETKIFEDNLRLQKESISREIETLTQEIGSNSSSEKLAQLNKRLANLEKKEQVFTMQDFKKNVEQPKEAERAAITAKEFNAQETKLGYEGKIPKDPAKQTKSDEPNKTTTQNPAQQPFAASSSQKSNSSVNDPIFKRSSFESEPVDVPIESNQVAKSNLLNEEGTDLGISKQTVAPQQPVRQERPEAPSERILSETTPHPIQEQIFTDVSGNDIVEKDPIGLNNVMSKVSNFNEVVTREATRFLQIDKGKSTETETTLTPIPLSEELKAQAIDLGNNLLNVIQRAESFEVASPDVQQTSTSSLGKEQIIEKDEQKGETQHVPYTSLPAQTILNLINLNQHIQSAVSSGFISPLLQETLSKMHSQIVSSQTSQEKTESQSSSLGPVSKSSGEGGNQGGSSGQGGQGQQQGQEKEEELSFPKMDTKEVNKKLEALTSGQSIIYSQAETLGITVARKLDNGAIEQQTFTPSKKGGYDKTSTTHIQDGNVLTTHHFHQESTNGIHLMGAGMPPIKSETEFNTIASRSQTALGS